MSNYIFTEEPRLRMILDSFRVARDAALDLTRASTYHSHLSKLVKRYLRRSCTLLFSRKMLFVRTGGSDQQIQVTWENMVMRRGQWRRRRAESCEGVALSELGDLAKGSIAVTWYARRILLV